MFNVMMQSKDTSKSYLPLPEFGDQSSFKQRNQNDSYRTSKRPPKLYQKSHDSSYHNRSLNQSSLPQSISFREQSNNSSTTLGSIYKPTKQESYFEQCFDVLAKIGEGSFGEVFKVRSKEDGRLYAIKKSIQLYRGESYRTERLEEVRRYEQFSEHKNCITLYRAWEQGDLLYMQLELCQGSLESMLEQQSQLPEAKVWHILVDLLLALKALHDQNLIHLDIKLDNIMIGEDNICKLGDFGLVIDLSRLNLHQATEGDSRYIAPELLSGRFTKAADIFSLGITILELACNLELPKNGLLWHKLRSGALPDEFFPLLSRDLQNIIRWMMDPDPNRRPDVNTLLATDRIQKLLAKRRMLGPLSKVKQFHRNILSTWLNLRTFIYNIFTAIFSVLKLKCANGRRASIAETSTPQLTKHQPVSDNSFFLLEDSDIDFEESPNVRNNNKSFYNTPDIQIVNSTPLNHYNSQGSFRRNRSELSRTSLIFDDNENIGNANNSSNSRSAAERKLESKLMTPIKCKKLFEHSDDSE